MSFNFKPGVGGQLPLAAALRERALCAVRPQTLHAISPDIIPKFSPYREFGQWLTGCYMLIRSCGAGGMKWPSGRGNWLEYVGGGQNYGPLLGPPKY